MLIHTFTLILNLLPTFSPTWTQNLLGVQNPSFAAFRFFGVVLGSAVALKRQNPMQLIWQLIFHWLVWISFAISSLHIRLSSWRPMVVNRDRQKEPGNFSAKGRFCRMLAGCPFSPTARWRNDYHICLALSQPLGDQTPESDSTLLEIKAL